MLKTLIVGIAIASSGSNAIAQSFLLNADAPRSLLYRQIGDRPQMVCIDLRNADGMASPDLVSQVSHTANETGEAAARLLDARVQSGTTCFQVPDDIARYEIFGTAMEEPVIVRAGRSRCALRDRGASRFFDACQMAEPGALDRLPMGR